MAYRVRCRIRRIRWRVGTGTGCVRRVGRHLGQRLPFAARLGVSRHANSPATARRCHADTTQLRPHPRRRRGQWHRGCGRRRAQGRVGQRVDPGRVTRARRTHRRASGVAHRSWKPARPALETRTVAAQAPDRAAGDAGGGSRVDRHPARAGAGRGSHTAHSARRRRHHGPERLSLGADSDRRRQPMDRPRPREPAVDVRLAPARGRSARDTAAARQRGDHAARRSRRRIDADHRDRPARRRPGPRSKHDACRSRRGSDQPGVRSAGRRLGGDDARDRASVVSRSTQRVNCSDDCCGAARSKNRCHPDPALPPAGGRTRIGRRSGRSPRCRRNRGAAAAGIGACGCARSWQSDSRPRITVAGGVSVQADCGTRSPGPRGACVAIRNAGDARRERR